MRSDTLLPLAILAPVHLAMAAAACDKFSTNGLTAATYDFYRFYDFRNLDSSDDAPAFAASNEKARTFSTVPWRAGWDARTFLSPASKTHSVDLQYTPSEIFITDNTEASQASSTYLTLHTTRASNSTQLSAELRYKEFNVTHASIRLSGRVRGASGAVAGFFTYYNDTTESDIEILTRDPSRQIRYSNQPLRDPRTDQVIGGSTFNKTLNHRTKTSDWNIHRLDWITDLSAWYANGALSAATNVNVPDVASIITLNMWSNGGSFSGEMEIGEEAWFDVQWVELMFNTGTSSTSKSGKQVCSAESSPGTPMPVGQSINAARRGGWRA